MECTLCGTIIEHKSTQYIKLYDGIGRPSILRSNNELLQRVGRFMGQFEPLAAIWEFVHTYHFSSSPTALAIRNAERELLAVLWRFIGYWKALASSAIQEEAIRSPGTRSMVFDYCYFGNSLALHVGANGLLILTGLDKGNLDLSDEKVDSKGYLQVSRMGGVHNDHSSSSQSDALKGGHLQTAVIVMASTLSGGGKNGDRSGGRNDDVRSLRTPDVGATGGPENGGPSRLHSYSYAPVAGSHTSSSRQNGQPLLHASLRSKDIRSDTFITSITASPMCSFGTLLLVTFSDGALELWKESVSLSNFTDRIWSSIGSARIDGYPYYSLFSPSGELALVVSTEGTSLLTCPGLEAVRIANGSSSHLWSGLFWSTPNFKIVAVEWINNHEFLSLTEHRHLMLTRRHDPGFWKRVAHFDLQCVDVVPDEARMGTARLQIDGTGRVYLLMQNSLQIVRLTWHDHETPECIVLKLAAKDLLIHAGMDEWVNEMDGVGVHSTRDLMAYDLTVDPVNDLMAVVVEGRRLVCIYNLQSMRLLHVIKPPKSQLKAMGLKFCNKGGILAVRWVAISREVMEGLLDEEYREFEIEHSAILGDLPYQRCTLVYKVSGMTKRVMEDCFADIIAGNNATDAFEVKRPAANARPFRENIYSVDEFIQRKRNGFYT